MNMLRAAFAAFVCIGGTCLAQDKLPQPFSDKPIRPAWWFQLMESDLCVKASEVALIEDKKEYLMDEKKGILAEYTPVKMKIERVLSASPKIKFDGRFLFGENKSYVLKPGSDLIIYLINLKSAGAAAVVDSHTMGAHPQLPKSGIFTLNKSNHKKGGEFVIAGFSEAAMEGDYTKALQE